MLTVGNVIQVLLTIASPVLVVVLCVYGARRGLFRSDALDAGPKRDAMLTWVDLVGGVVLWLVGQAIGQVIALGYLGAIDTVREGGALDFSADQLLVVMAGSSLGTLIAIAFYWFRIGQAMPGEHREWGLHPSHLGRALPIALRGLGFILPFMFTISAATSIALWSVGVDPPEVAHAVLDIILREAWGVRLGFIAFAVLVAPTVEEIVFRGWIQTTLQTSGIARSRWTAIFATTVVFTLIHIDSSNPASLAALPALYTFSIGLGWVYERSGNLIACILMHMLFNASQVLLALSMQLELPIAGVQ